MIPKFLKNFRRLYKSLLLIIIILFSSQVAAGESERVINIKVYSDTLINKYFYGFGAETLPWLWTKENRDGGVNEEDIRLNVERIKDMHLPITRMFVPWETWNPSLDYKTFTWESDEMKSLYKTLDVYQAMATNVILVTVDWLKDSPWKDIRASSEAVLRLLEYLVKEKGYSCIKFWTLTNEPELTYGWLEKMPFKNYVQIHQLVKEGLIKRKLAIKIIVSDEIESQEWFNNSMQSLYKIADIFSSHLYLYPQQINLIPDFFRERLNIIKKSSLAKRDIPFFLCEFGFRGSDFGSRTNNLMDDYEYGIYVARLCIEALNSGVDAASLWCLHQVRLIDEINPEGGKMMRIGLWAYKDDDWRPFPIFYLYQLFVKYIKSSSKVLRVKVSPPNILEVSCVEHSSNYSLFIVNPTDKEQRFLVKWNHLVDLDCKKYLYSKSEVLFFNENILRPNGHFKIKKYIKDKISPQSVILYTNLGNDLVIK